MFLVSEEEQNIEKINAHEWTLVMDGIRDQVWAKLKGGKVHVISSYYDEDGFFSRSVYIGNTYKEATNSERVFNHFETFEPIDFDSDEDNWNE
jgi:hypothetical protein